MNKNETLSEILVTAVFIVLGVIVGSFFGLLTGIVMAITTVSLLGYILFLFIAGCIISISENVKRKVK